ncbi:MAG: alpha/beta hydrolase, partial [Alphaproteobacteria bacterium]|nr:alpha/beta hydrolase [Alphaproteobacteria bacterium]
MDTAHQEDLSFQYFPGNYRWSHGMLIGLNAAPWGGAEIGEVHRVALALRGQEGDDAAWFGAWAAEAGRVEAAGRARLATHPRSAAAYLLRAANYYHVGERFLQPKTAEGVAAYQRGVACFREAVKHIARPRVEHVEVPYEGTSLPAILVHAEGAAPRAPAMIFFDGFDVTKEIQYFKGIPDLVARGIACLIVDGPGNGEAVRFRKLVLHHETERYATAAYEWLAARPEIDPKRIGVMALSLGGYYAPRAAAFEPRLKACVAWGARWDNAGSHGRILTDPGAARSVPNWVEHALWYYGADTPAAAATKIARMTLDGVAERIRCPLLVVHGANDRQVPLEQAERTVAAARLSP